MGKIIANIPRIVPGGPSLVSAELANMLIDRVNALTSMQIVGGANIAVVSVTGSQVFLDFSKLDNRLRNPTMSANGTCTGNNIVININLNI